MIGDNEWGNYRCCGPASCGDDNRNCNGPRCAAWRWFTPPPRGTVVADDIRPAKGYCGLAGPDKP